jgi:hypothetical protein
VLWNCEGVMLFDVMQRGVTVNSDTCTITPKNEEVFPMCLAWQEPVWNVARPHTSVKTQEAVTQFDGRCYLIHPIAQM